MRHGFRQDMDRDVRVRMPHGRELVLRKDGAVEFHGPELFPLRVLRARFEVFSPRINYFDDPGPVVTVYRNPDEPRGVMELTLVEPTTGTAFERRYPVIDIELM